VKASKFCDLTISPAKLRQIHKKRLRVRDAIREMKTKLYRLKHQLRQLENEKKEMMLSKWSVINTLKNKKKALLPKVSKLPFDVFFEQFRFSKSLNWSLLTTDSLDLDETSEWDRHSHRDCL